MKRTANGGIARNLLLSFPMGLICLAGWICLPTPLRGQEKSVRPMVNKSFERPNVNQFVERFEREGREVYDHREKIIAACELKDGGVVADVGAGTGLFTRLLAAQVGPKGKVYAVDIAPEFVKHVELSSREAGLKNIKGVVCPKDAVALPEESIDLAFICDTYHHFEFPYKTMRSIFRALRPGGQVVLVEFHREKGLSSDWIMNHVRANQATFVSEIKLAGFEVVDENKFMKTSYWMRFKKSNRLLPSGHSKDSLRDVARLLADGTATLLDVREPSEWNSGHLQQAKLLPMSQLRSSGDKPSAALAKLLPKDKIIYCHCRSGGRALGAARTLESWGFDVRPLRAGFDDLQRAGFPAAD